MTLFDAWPPATPGDDPHELVVFGASVEAARPAFERLRAVLSDDELARAEAFHFERDCVSYVVAHAVLRHVVGERVGSDPRALRFAQRDGHKPELEHPRADATFNLSHAGDGVVVALAIGFEVGVDVEEIRSDVEHDTLAERFFSPAESAALRSRTPAGRVESFFACWTRKEAVVKAAGGGLSIDLASFDVDVDATTQRIEAEGRQWFVHALDPGPGYAGAVASARDVSVARRRWSPPS